MHRLRTLALHVAVDAICRLLSATLVPLSRRSASLSFDRLARTAAEKHVGHAMADRRSDSYTGCSGGHLCSTRTGEGEK